MYADPVSIRFWLIAGWIGAAWAVWVVFGEMAKREGQDPGRARLAGLAVVVLLMALFSAAPALGQLEYTVGFGGVSLDNPTGTYVWDATNNSRRRVSTDGLVLSYDMSSLDAGDLQDFSLRGNEGDMRGGTFDTSFEDTLTSVSDDAYVREIDPTNPYGSGTGMDVRQKGNNPDTGDRERSYVTISTASIPGDATIVSATLNLYANNVDSGSHNIRAYRVTSSWDEGTITWNAQPTIDSGSFESTTITSTGWKTWDATTFVTNWFDGTWDNHGLSLRQEPESCDQVACNAPQQVSFNTKEAGGSNPYIDITYTRPITTPTIPAVQSTYGHARDFDGSDDYVESGYDLPDGDITAVAVIRAEDLTSADNAKGILSKRGTTRGWAIVARDTQNDIAFQWHDKQTSSFNQEDSDDGVISLNTTHIVGVRFIQSSLNLSFWVDGSQAGAATLSDEIEDTAGTVTLGENIQDPDRFWVGWIDETALFTQAKSDLEMEYLTTPEMTITVPEPPPSGGPASATYQGLVVWAAVAMVVFWLALILYTAFGRLAGSFR